MADQVQPIKFYVGGKGANPPRVKIILEELNLPYKTVMMRHVELKGPEYVKINPNGRLPAIHDPNTGITVWESGAILLYLVARYDAGRKLSFPEGSDEATSAQQWLFFQASGQGPYYGQAMWFKLHHHEQLPSAKERYVKEVNRVTGVLESWLAKQEDGGQGRWLVGGKMSYADLAFAPWQLVVNRALKEDGFDGEAYPLVKEWMGHMMARPAVQRGVESMTQ